MNVIGQKPDQHLVVPREIEALLIDRVGAATSLEIAQACVRYLNNTASTTVDLSDREPFVITGDIPAMWLRDSCAQMFPFMRLAHLEPKFAKVAAGLLKRHWRMIILDPYANAFNKSPNSNRWDDDVPLQNPHVWERKWESDSLSFPIYLAAWLNKLGDTSWLDQNTLTAFESILNLLEVEADHERNSNYLFQRPMAQPKDTLTRSGQGPLTVPCGLIWQGFRPSDDACEEGFNIPGNLFIARALELLPDLLVKANELNYLQNQSELNSLLEKVKKIRNGILAGLDNFGKMFIESVSLGLIEVWAYEVDGAEEKKFMDDANFPSLLSLPYLGICDVEDELYQRTRKAILSPLNPYYFAGSELQGVGSAHTPSGFVWPIALAIEGLTLKSKAKKIAILERLLQTSGGSGYMHESVNCNDHFDFTRPWFSWANSMFVELALEVSGFEKPI